MDNSFLGFFLLGARGWKTCTRSQNFALVPSRSFVDVERDYANYPIRTDDLLITNQLLYQLS